MNEYKVIEKSSNVMSCPFCGKNPMIRYAVNTGNVTIGCENPKCVNWAMQKSPVPGYTESELIEMWNTRFENDVYPLC